MLVAMYTDAHQVHSPTRGPWPRASVLLIAVYTLKLVWHLVSVSLPWTVQWFRHFADDIITREEITRKLC